MAIRYCTIPPAGCTLSDEDFALWTIRASRVIDRLTLGQAEAHAKDLAEELSDACGQMAVLMAQADAAATKTAAGLLASASNDGYSESYRTWQEGVSALSARLWAILRDSLGADPYGLLYQGVGLC